MIDIEDIRKPITTELSVFRDFFKSSVKTKVALLDRVNRYILSKKGKQLRPILVLLSSKLCGEIRNSSYTAATLVELFHTATLVHDDVVDDAMMRRGIFSINAIWKSKVPILVGDFLLSRSMLVALENNEYRLLEIISTAVKEISEGELLQLDKSRKQKTSIEVYLTIIRKKTAILFASCTQAGATASTDDTAKIKALYNYGMALGMAFQMQDDLLDFDRTNRLGKLLYNDIKERKMTLPFIYSLQQSDEKKRILKTFKKKKKTRAELNKIATFIEENGGIDYTRKEMEKYREEALQELVVFEESPAKEALMKLAYFVTQRKK